MTATPLMQQYREIKSRHQDAILFFRMGEFYEMFYDDAETASRTLGLTLTSRNNGAAAEVPLAGVPVKAAAEYVRRLVQHGYRVAICEQMEDPRVAKGIVVRPAAATTVKAHAGPAYKRDGMFVVAAELRVGIRVTLTKFNLPHLDELFRLVELLVDYSLHD